jgi:hypothetical protein
MGPEPFFLLAWLLCAGLSLTLAVKAWWQGEGYVSVATLTGFAAGIAPLFLLSGPPVLGAIIALACVAAVVLALSYAARGRRGYLGVTLAFVVIPLLVAFLPRSIAFPRELSVVRTLVLIGELVSIFAPILMALAAREVTRLITSNNRTV